MTAAATVHVVVPRGIDDPNRPSGGNTYDRRVCDQLSRIGWDVRLHAVAPDGLAPALAGLPDGALVLIDGLLGRDAGFASHAHRLRLALLVHMAPAADDETLSAARAVITTSAWMRRQLLELFPLPPDRVHVAEPGVDAAYLAPGTADGGRLLCVAAVAPHKGHDVLVAALTEVADRSWRCTCVGSLEVDADFVARLRAQAGAGGLADRVDFAGPLTGPALDLAYVSADVLVLASTSESYGMVVTEALARGMPVIASAVGGVPDALGWTQAGGRPGLLLPPGDPLALSEALRRWLDDVELRASLRSAALERRRTLKGWESTGYSVAAVLDELKNQRVG